MGLHANYDGITQKQLKTIALKMHEEEWRINDEGLIIDLDDETIALEAIEDFDPRYNHDYLVLTDDEAEEAWDAALDSYLEECVLSTIEGPLKDYFDTERWKNDAKHDGRGHSLSSYDGEEHEETVDGETFYIYKQ